MSSPTKIAVLDDYQGVSRDLADWSRVDARADVTIFRDNIVDQEALADRLSPFEVICVMRERTPLSKTLLERLPNLRLVVTTGHRNASIDADAVDRLGIEMRFTGSTSHAPTEMAWALILAAMRNLPTEFENVRAGGWQTTIGTDLNGATIGIVGLGKTGATMARIATAFGMNVIAWSQNLTEQRAVDAGAIAVSKEELFRTADIVTLHLVFSERTKAVVAQPELVAMKSSAWIINTSRAQLIDKAALIEALETRSIAGAAMDVFEMEPLGDDDLFRRLSNVISTPHIGFVTKKTYEIMYGQIVNLLEHWLDRPPSTSRCS